MCAIVSYLIKIRCRNNQRYSDEDMAKLNLIIKGEDKDKQKK